jgi:hypothetical protein
MLVSTVSAWTWAATGAAKANAAEASKTGMSLMGIPSELRRVT